MTARIGAVTAWIVIAVTTVPALAAVDATAAAVAGAPDAVAHSDTASPWASARGHDRYGYWADLTVSGVVQRLRWIPAGVFMMGSPDYERGRTADETPHLVMVARPLWMADSVCTQEMWQAVMGANPSMHIGAAGPVVSVAWLQRPVEEVSWHDCQQFLAAINGQDPMISTHMAVRLPSEAEWEYACRAGTITPIPTTALLDTISWFGAVETCPVKQRAANPWGLYDLLGEVRQWCGDWHGAYPYPGITAPIPVTDTGGPPTGTHHVLRGGSFDCEADVCRSAARYWCDDDTRNFDQGFRFCIGVPDTDGAQAFVPSAADIAAIRRAAIDALADHVAGADHVAVCRPDGGGEWSSRTASATESRAVLGDLAGLLRASGTTVVDLTGHRFCAITTQGADDRDETAIELDPASGRYVLPGIGEVIMPDDDASRRVAADLKTVLLPTYGFNPAVPTTAAAPAK